MIRKLFFYMGSMVITNIKLVLGCLIGNHVQWPGVNLISSSVHIQSWGKTSQIALGRKIHIRGNTELRASNGCISIGDNVFINRNCVICSHGKITIRDLVTIGPNTCIFDHDHGNSGSFITAPIVIEEGCWIGANVVILKGVTVGHDSIVAAGSVVTKNVPPNSVVGGVPAKIIKGRTGVPESI